MSKRRAIEEQSDINKRLTRDSLSYLDDAISLITGAIAGAGYDATGFSQTSCVSPALISREV